MATHSSTLAWKIPWMEEARRLQSTGSLRVRHNRATSLSFFTFMHWRRKWQPTHSSILAWRIPGTEEPSGLPSMGLHRVGHDRSDAAAAAAAAREMNAIVWQFEHSLPLPFFGLGMKTDLFSPGTTAKFSKFADISSASFSHNHLLGFEITHLEFHHLLWLCS